MASGSRRIMKRYDSALQSSFPQQRVVPFQPTRIWGAVAIEYALVASLIAMVIVVGLVLVGMSVGALFDRVAACFVDPASCIGGTS